MSGDLMLRAETAAREQGMVFGPRRAGFLAGYEAGFRGGRCEPPAWTRGSGNSAWMRGWNTGRKLRAQHR
jgi:hypothetical protein